MGVCWVRCSNGVLWKLDLSNSSHRWCVFGDYEGPVQMRWMNRWLAQGGHVIDSGANIGQMTLFLHKLVGVTIHAFEPTESAANWLEASVSENAASNIQIIRRGLSSSQRAMAIQLDGARSTLRMDWYAGAGLETELVELIRLDDYLEKKSLEKVRLWKLDVEGHELEALQGAARALKTGAIEAILIEISESTAETVSGYLASVGYGLFRISEKSTLEPFSGPVTHNSNFVAIPAH